MNQQSFLEKFRHLANAPSGVEKLRELVLCLAMQGKLSVRNASDTSVDDLLAEVNREKQVLIEEGFLRGLIQPIPVRPEEKSHPIPKEWKWIRFGQIAEHNAGKTLDQRRNTGIPRDYITTSNVYWGRFELDVIRQMLIRDEELERCTARKGDLLICEGGEAGRAAVWPYDREVSFQNHVHRARFYAGINPYYVFRFLQKLNATGEINHYRKGVGISNMSGKALASIPLPLPPLEEQERIVAKIDELMAVCDKLHSQQQERGRRFPILSRTCHARLAEAPTPANLNRIFDEAGSVYTDDLRKTILTLASKGELVPQDTREEPAPKLLARIDVEREHLLSGGYPNPDEAKSQLRKQREQRLPDGLRELPVGWKWATLMQISLLIADCHNKTAPYVSSGIRLIRTTNIRNGQLNKLEPKYVTEATYERWSARCKPEPGDILITREAPMGEVCIIPQGMKLCMGQRMMLIRLVPGTVDANFLLYSLMDPALMQRVQDKPIGATVQHLRVGGVETLLVAVPPLSEQLRIVAKVDELMALVNHLEAQQQERDKLAEAFAKACVASLTGTAEFEKLEKMKAPKTELVSIVTLDKKPKPDAKAPLSQILIQNKGTLSAKSLWQQSGLTIDEFYQQLKTEIAQGWIAQPAQAQMKTVEKL